LTPPGDATRGRLLVGTSGFAYPAWSPRFYPPGLGADELLGHYARRFPAVELNNTFYQQPSPAKVAAWLRATPADFAFAVKAQRGGSLRAFRGDPAGSIPWLTGPYRLFGDRLGAVLLRVADDVPYEPRRLEAVLDAWPVDLPLALEPRHASWTDDGAFELLRRHRVAIVATEMPEDEGPPTLRLTGPFLYLRLRRHDYSPAEIDGWAARIEPFLSGGHDAWVFFRHDEVGRAPELADELRACVERRMNGLPVAGMAVAPGASARDGA
jgi:uncharacterized protein YecE (DUF72 family)